MTAAEPLDRARGQHVVGGEAGQRRTRQKHQWDTAYMAKPCGVSRTHRDPVHVERSAGLGDRERRVIVHTGAAPPGDQHQVGAEGGARHRLCHHRPVGVGQGGEVRDPTVPSDQRAQHRRERIVSGGLRSG